MLKIISRPPFDDFSIGLFFSLYAKRNQHKMGDALFMYMWTGPISSSNGVYINHSNIHYLRKNGDMSKYVMTNGIRVAGDNRFFNDKEEMFKDYLNVTEQNDLSEEECNQLREDFYELYEIYAANTVNISAIENILEDTISTSNKSVVVLFVKDHFRTNTRLSWTNPVSELSRYFVNMCEFYSDKKFVIVSSLENLDKEITCENCTVVNMGGDITNQISSYMAYTPEIRKDASKNFISLNRGSRYHRLYLISQLFARNLDSYGQTSMLGKKSDSTELKDVVKYNYENDPSYENANHGWQRYLHENIKAVQDSYDIYPEKGNDNLSNFQQSLQPKYLNSYVEFISETSYNEKSFNITEKTLHFIYGCNYPIMISSPGTVKFLRSIGIDMFDDVIDHSYDDITDPAERINSAIDCNIGILTLDLDTLHKRWESDKYRMEANISFVQNKLANFYKDRFWEQIKGLPL